MLATHSSYTEYESCVLLPHNCNFALFMDHNVNIRYAGYLICDLQKGHDPQVENHSLRTLLDSKWVIKADPP